METLTIEFSNIATVDYETGPPVKMTKREVESEIRYIMDHLHPTWTAVTYTFGSVSGTVRPK